MKKAGEKFAMSPKAVALAVAYAIDPPNEINIGEIILRSTTSHSTTVVHGLQITRFDHWLISQISDAVEKLLAASCLIKYVPSRAPWKLLL